MTDSENSAGQDDSDEDIYKDFDDFNFGGELAKIEASKENYKKEASDLSDKLSVLAEENEKLKKLNGVLEKNLSILLKTAQAEVKRKDSMIADLRVQLDSFTFRRNKQTKDKYTCTENSSEFTNSFRDNLSKGCCKCGQDRVKESSSSSSSDKGKTSGECDGKPVKNDSNGKGIKENRAGDREDCDTETRVNYNSGMKGSLRSSVNANSSEFTSEQSQGKTRSSSRGKSRTEYESHWKSHRKHSFDGRNRHYKHSDKRSFSPREKYLKSLRERSPERKDRRRESRRNRSRSSRSRSRSRGRSRSWSLSPPRDRERSKGSKESSLEKHKSSRRDTATEEKAKKGGKPESGTRSRESESGKTSGRKDEEVKRSDKGRTAETSANDSKVGKKVAKRNSGTMDAISPLDALYSEMVTGRRCLSKTVKDTSKPVEEVIEEEPEEGELSKSSLAEVEDWTRSFKNERPKTASAPMTLYSKRMIKKFSLDSQTTDGKSSGAVADPVTTAEPVQPTIQPVRKVKPVEEKEPGELTDDENLVETSKEFQEVAKAAYFETNVADKSLDLKPEETVDKNQFVFKEPLRKETLPVPGPRPNPADVPQKKSAESRLEPGPEGPGDKKTDAREVIEFSPFKNNYRLIEISPMKRPETRARALGAHATTTGSQTQKQVNASIFNLLSSLSGVPIAGSQVPVTPGKSEPCDDTATSQVLGETGGVQEPENRSAVDDKVEEKDVKANKEGSKSPRGGRATATKNTRSKTVAQRKKTTTTTTKKVGREKKSPSSEAEKEQKQQDEEEETAPGETTQFLDFFLMTTSPSKPILAAEQEKALRKSRSKAGGEKSESDGHTTNTSGTSEGKESPPSSSSVSSVDKGPTTRLSSSRGKRVTTQVRGADESKTATTTGRPKRQAAGDGKATESDDQAKGRRQTTTTKKDQTDEGRNEKGKRKRRGSEESGPTEKKVKTNGGDIPGGETSLNSTKSDKSDCDGTDKAKEDISFFEFFKPIAKRDEGDRSLSSTAPTAAGTGTGDHPANPSDFKMTMSLTGVVRLETPIKTVEKLKNVTINEQTIYQVLDGKNAASFSPLITGKNAASFSPLLGGKLVEMTPRRMLRNDLMLTDSEDDSAVKISRVADEDDDDDEGCGGDDDGLEEDEEEEDDDDDDEDEVMSDDDNENSECDSDSGASNFVDLL